VLELAIVVTGEPMPSVRERRGDWAAMIQSAMAHEPVHFTVLDARAGRLPALADFDGVIITGSSSSVTERAEWMLRAEARLREAVSAGTRVLGICFGHQLLGQALGGTVSKNPSGREIGTVALELVANDPFFMEPEAPLLVNMTHLDSVVRLPPGARVVARTALEPHAVVRFAERVLGVQFHPEIDAQVMAEYVQLRRELLLAEGLDADAIRAAVSEAPAGRRVLGRFLEEVRRGQLPAALAGEAVASEVAERAPSG
jgi:GMP synthase (glutamine-hydrolysing)